MFRKAVRLLQALLSWADGRVKAPSVCTERCQSTPALPCAGGAALCVMERAPWAPHRLFVESIYEQDVSDWLCLCWLLALHSPGVPLPVLHFPGVQGGSCHHTEPCPITWHWGFCASVQGKGCLCLDIFTFFSSFLSLKTKSRGLHPSRENLIFYCCYPLKE